MRPPASGTTPHDTFAKFAFRDRARAAEALAAALGSARTSLIDWSSLEPEPTEVADDALNRFLPDLRFKARLQDREVHIEVIFEHQSDIDPLMAVRFFCETGAIWSAARREQRPRVPLVLNVVLYNGLTPWTAPRELWAAIDGGDYFRERAPDMLPHLPMIVEDLAALSDADIEARPCSAAVRLILRLLKQARRGGGVQTLREAGALVQATDDDVLRESVRYVLQVDPAATRDSIAEVLVPVLGPQGREIAMTEGERLIQQGEARGELIGQARGEAIGEARGAASALLRVLRRSGVALTREQQARIDSEQDAARIGQWIDECLAGRSIDDILGSDLRH